MIKTTIDRKFYAAVLASALVALSGCGQEDPEVLAQRARFVLDAKPASGQGVVQLREAVTQSALQEKDEVTVVGQIGGVENPWTDGYASFVIIDPEVAAHAHEEDDGCEFCRKKREKKAMALVQLVNEKGEVVPIDAQRLLKVRKDQQVTVLGQAKIDEQGNLVVKASGVYLSE